MAKKTKFTPVTLTVDLFDDSIRDELAFAGDRSAIAAITDKEEARVAKRNYAQRLSNQLAVRLANALRPSFDGILPNEKGEGQESKARTSKGYKRLDVNYSNPKLGLGLGVSVKTLNFKDPKQSRFTKNMVRIDNELRAEASDYHERQPYAVMIGVVFLPIDTCLDGATSHSSFGHAVQVYRHRSGRADPKDTSTKFERIFVGLYDTNPAQFGQVSFFDVMQNPPRNGVPKNTLTPKQLVAEITKTYDERNHPFFEWSDAAPELADEEELEVGLEEAEEDDEA